jgi:transcription-repair coupling factor (superfamily II helicase)
MHLAVTHSEGAIVLLRDHAQAERFAQVIAALLPGAAIGLFPASDALPGAPASAANVGARVGALHALNVAREEGRAAFLVASAEATALPVPPPEAFAPSPPRFAVGDAIDPGRFAERADALGYVCDDRVDEPGEFAIRGAVIDIFPVDKPLPVRIGFSEAAIEQISCYDPLTQRSVEELAAIEIGRACEPADPASVLLIDHLSDRPIFVDPSVAAHRQRFVRLASEQRARTVEEAAWHAALEAREHVPVPEPVAAGPRFVERRDPMRAFAAFARSALADGALLMAGSARDLRFLSRRIGKRLRLETERIDHIGEAFPARPGRLLSIEAPLSHGFALGGLTIVAAADLLGGRAGRGDQPGPAEHLLTTGELHIGDIVVHEDHGIARVTGLEPLGDGEAVRLEYARKGRRLVPMSEIDRLWRYGADAEAVALDGLDGLSWEKRRAAVHAAIAETARGLTDIAAKRDRLMTDPIVPDSALYERFAANFAFSETADQARAIAAIADDLASGRPMDRLVVGDVGYGKTEVAFRAAAMVALAGRQVAMVAPTTVLVRQHLEGLRKRFAGTGIEIAGLSRIDNAAARRRVAKGLQDGSIGIVVGTTALAAKAVAFRDLALVVIDEEQRFGAADKGRIKAMGAGHSLSLSATPIPRSLQGALVGLQRLSIIATPPARRQPSRTLLAEFDEATVKAALLRESVRGGQSFVVVPRIEDIDPLRARLGSLVPELGIVTVHGKMPVADIDAAMVDFANGDGDILLATNIIEAGLDVPRANTMIVHHADRFGLSQLHQLRGRVGRGVRRGQILLTTEPGKRIASRTTERLRTLQAFDQLGAGFAISARDLDLRGAGDLLGEEQAGHMKLIGVDLYQHMLAHALRRARGDEAEHVIPELNLGASGHLPKEWIPEEGVRLSLYARLARVATPGALDDFADELEDRFGELPDAAERLIETARIRLLAGGAKVARIDAGPSAVAYTPHDPDADWSKAGLALRGKRWIDARAIDDEAERLAAIRETLEALDDA